MITERTLKKWRREALKELEIPKLPISQESQEIQKRILRMTQELLDLHLTREK